MTTHIDKQMWLAGLASQEARVFFGELTELLAEQGIHPSLTKAGYFGVPIERDWHGRSIKVHLSDSYRAKGTFNFPVDTLRIGYGQKTPAAIKVALDPWIAKLDASYSGRSTGKIARYKEWGIPSD